MKERNMSVQVIEELDASVEVVWDLVGNFGGLKRWNPFISECLCQGEGVGALRTVKTPEGRETIEQVDALDPEGHLLDYRVVSMRPATPMVGMRVTLRLDAMSPDRTRLTWTGRLAQPLADAESLYAGIGAGFRSRIEALRNALVVQAQRES